MDWTILILLLTIGLLLIALEIFFIPGITVFGITGNLLLLAGIIYAFIYLPFVYALLVLLGSLLAVGGFLYWFFKAGIERRLALTERETRKEGYKPFRENYTKFQNQTGIAVSPLRPAGRIKIGNTSLSAVTQGGYIQSGETVRVIKVEGSKVIVEQFTK